MTLRLYYEDPYLKEFEGKVLECRRAGAEWEVRMDRSAFYPTSGGQPFDTGVLMAKLQALLRRSYDFSQGAPILEHRGALLHTADQTLSVNGARVELSKNEYRILLTLLQEKGRVVSRERLMEALWQTDCFVDENTLSVNVTRLRKKLDAAGLPGFITTKIGSGYLIAL